MSVLDTLSFWLARTLLFYDQKVLIYFAVLNLFYLGLFFISLVRSIQYARFSRVPFSRSFLQSPLTLPVSILVPAHNEEKVIRESVLSFLSVHYGVFEVIVINDGSSDKTLQTLQEAYGLKSAVRANPGLLPTQPIRGIYESARHPNLVVIDKEKGGKSDALNAGINFSRYPIFCNVDADSVLEPESLARVVRPFLRDPRVVAVGGVIRIANGNEIRRGVLERIQLPKNPLALFQTVEYLRAFFAGRMGWSALGCLLIISGAFGVFRKEEAVRSGGYRRENVGEDMDLVVRMHRRLREESRPYRMVFIPDPICWTEVPENLADLRLQRDRWQRGLVQSLRGHFKMFLNFSYGPIGWLAMPYFVLFEMIGPVVELGGYLAIFLSILLGIVDWRFVGVFFTASMLFGALLSVGAVSLEEMSFRRYPKLSHVVVLLFLGLLENVGYRQLNTWWRAAAVFRAMSGQGSWGQMARKGFAGARASYS